MPERQTPPDDATPAPSAEDELRALAEAGHACLRCRVRPGVLVLRAHDGCWWDRQAVAWRDQDGAIGRERRAPHPAHDATREELWSPIRPCQRLVLVRQGEAWIAACDWCAARKDQT